MDIVVFLAVTIRVPATRLIATGRLAKTVIINISETEIERRLRSEARFQMNLPAFSQ